MEETSKGMPQFATAEYAAGAPTLSCAQCRSPITGPYYQINGASACPGCTQKIQAQVPKDTHAAFTRAILFGVAGAILGFALYVGFALATGLVIGWVSLAVGFIVGKAMSLGSRGAGGRRYQIAAVVLTYLAVSLSAVPIAIQQMRHQHQTPAASQQSQSPASETAAQPREKMGLGRAIGVLALLGVASPLLELQDPVHGIIGLIILFVGIRFAWRFTAGRNIHVSGPHTPAPPGAV